MENRGTRQEQGRKAQETTDDRPEYQKPDITTYTGDELEDKIGPALTPIAVREAALVLLRETRQMPEHVLENDMRQSSAGSLLTRIARLLDGVGCYSMTTGKLESMCRLAREALGTEAA